MGKQHIPKNLRRKEKKKSVRAAAPVLCLVLFVLLIGAVMARYQRQLGADVPARAKEFYFTSDFLDGKTHTLAPESTEVTFTLGNHADELRYSEVDIDYEVTVTDGSGSKAPVKVTTDSGNGETKNDTGTLGKGEVSDAKVTISDLKTGTYNVTAVGTGGYSQTLTAQIVVLPKEAKLYQYQENVSGEYMLLTVWNEGDVAGEVTIQYTGIPDNTNPNMTDWETNSVKENITIEPHASKVFRFFSGTVKVMAKDSGTDVERRNPS